MWEIENNPDVLALGKDPKAEEFLCDIYDTENPESKVPDNGGADPSVEKAADVENPEIHDVEGIMNLEECEWNEIFTIEEQEIKNNVSTATGDIVPGTGVDANKSQSTRETKSSKSKLSSQSRATKCPLSSRQLYLAALNSNCKVVVEKISTDSINYIIEKFSSARSKPESGSSTTISTKVSIKRNQENTGDIKPKKCKNSVEPEKIDKKSKYLIEQRKIFNLNPMSTINKNSVSRIIDAITIDSDDNQSCIITNHIKSKSENLEGPKIKLKSKSKSNLVKSIKPSIDLDKMSDKTPATVPVNRSVSKPKHLKFKSDKKKDKKDWVDKNVKETPVTYENFFNNKKISILGSGFKITKKTTIQTDSKVENDADDQWSEAKKPVDDSVNVSSVFDNNNDDDDDDDCLWPKEKDQYDVGKSKKNDVEDSDDFNWPKERDQEPTDREPTVKSGGNANDNDDDDYEWPKEKQGYDDYNDNTKSTESVPETGVFKTETTDTSPVGNDIDGEDNESNQKWYGGGDCDSDEEAKNNAKSNDPWSKIISKNPVSNIKPEFLDDFSSSHLNDVIEIDDESEYGDPLKNAVKNETYSAPKKSYGNVWSRIQEIQNQLENNENAKSLSFNPEDMVLDSVDETLKNINYIKDAKWLNSKNEDFLDSYTENIDCGRQKPRGKWYNNDKRSSSPPPIISLMDIDLNRPKKSDFITTNSFPAAESWVDSEPYKSYKTASARPHGRHSPKNTRSNFVSPISKSTSFQNMTLEQLFPPFKKEYFKNSSNTFESSPEQSPNWHDTHSTSNHLLKSSNYQHHPGYYNTPGGGITGHQDAQNVGKQPKVNPRGASFPCYDVNGCSYPKNAHANGYSTRDSYSGVYGSRFPSKMPGSYPFYPRGGMVPVTPDSPDQQHVVDTAAHHLDPSARCGPASLDKSTKQPPLKFGPTGPKSNGNVSASSAHRPHNTNYAGPDGGPQCPPYQDMNAAYFYPYFVPPFTQPYGNPNQYHPFFSPYGTVSYTPASPDPEEMCPKEQPNQIG